MPKSTYRDLIVWKKGIELVEEVYKLTAGFPKDELYGLTSQMRRAAVSIPSNIAEGSRRKDLPEYLQFLRIADGSSAELETQLVIAERLYPKLSYARAEVLLDEIQRMLYVLKQKLELRKGK
jgi:four helix bundle protein